MILKKTGLTLLEVLIAVGVATILVGAIVMTLNACFDSYISGEREMRAAKFLDEIAQSIIYGSEDNAGGIHDAMEIIECGTHSITFVPLWYDTSHRPPYIDNEEFTLDKPYRHGSGSPIGEVSDFFESKAEYFEPVAIDYVEEEGDIIVTFKEPIPQGSRIVIVYWPDAQKDKKTAATLKWNPKTKKIARTYNGVTKEIKSPGLKNLELTRCEFRYFDNTGSEILPSSLGTVDEAHVSSITAVQINLATVVSEVEMELPTFVNLRNTRSSGAPIMIREGSEIVMPTSKDVTIFSISNIIGMKSGDKIEFLITPKEPSEKTMKVNIDLGIINNEPVIESYSVQYPEGETVFSEKVLMSTEMPFNFLEIADGKYDYDYDGNEKDVIEIKSPATLKVTRMDPRGAALYIRP